jgi:5-methylcytosine-specific restriction protein B
MQANKLVKDLKKYFEKLPLDSKIGDWIYKGESKIAYGTPGGAWDADDNPGYLFKEVSSEKEFLIRPVDYADRAYLAIESIHAKGQLLNHNLLDSKKYIDNVNSNQILESYKMTVGGGAVTRQIAKEFLEKNGFNTNGIVTQFSDSNFSPKNVTLDLLKWSLIKENAKNEIRSNKTMANKTTKTDTLTDNKIEYFPLNQILFGPPGTGKTFNTINKSLSILNVSTDSLTRGEIKNLFDEQLEEGNIVFTTFHQSMAYEDFIEGIKPITKNDNVIYEIVDGILKKLSTKALKSILSNIKNNKSKVQDFESIYNQFLLSIEEFSGQETYPFKSMHGSELKLLEIRKNSIVVQYRYSNNSTKSEAGTNEFVISKDKLKLLFENNVDVNDNIPLTVKFKPYFNYNKSVYFSVYKKFKEFIETNLGLSEDYIENIEAPNTFSDLYEQWSALSVPEKIELISKNKEKYVLIIDEINRGNVSQVFGELITLIENDKRLGSSEALEVTLPYSKDKFTVPPNLYIIGTMNTADRSVESLDTALRRRFHFVEMPPNPNLLHPKELICNFWNSTGINHLTWEEWKKEPYASKANEFYDFIGIDGAFEDTIHDLDEDTDRDLWVYNDFNSIEDAEFKGFRLDQILLKINSRLEKLLSKDHLIGHSFFINVKSVSELKSTFTNKVIPLLEEYFYGDFGKIGLVLGAGFVKIKNNDTDIFANFDYDIAALNEKIIYEIVDFTNPNSQHVVLLNDKNIDVDFNMAIKLLMKN